MSQAAAAAKREDVDAPNEWRRDWKSLKAVEGYAGGGITTTTKSQARAFMDMLVKGGMSAAKHNRTLMMCRKFFGWAVETTRATENPFDGIVEKRERKKVDITYLTRE